MKSTLNFHWKDWYWRWSPNTLAAWYEEQAHWKRSWCGERLGAGGEGDDRGRDVWMASATQWTWLWANSGRRWRTEKPGVLQSTRSQRVGHDLATEQQQQQEITDSFHCIQTGISKMTSSWTMWKLRTSVHQRASLRKVKKQPTDLRENS